MSNITIGIADPHTICREGVRRLLEQEGFDVVGEVSDGIEALALATKLQPQILLLELSMPRYSGLATVRDLKSMAASTRSLLLTGVCRRDELYEALKLGAYGWVSKSGPTQLLFRGIRAVASGEYWIGRENVGELIEALRRGASPGNGFRKTGRFGLTQRELQVVGKIVEGYSNGEIAKEFGVTERTIKHHLTCVFDKTGASSRLELALFAVHHSLAEAAHPPV
jgi:two-component system, NarL family, nitrate/nitrite response regulator NarL